MCGSMVDIQSPTSENRRGKRRKETSAAKYNGLPYWATSSYTLMFLTATLDRKETVSERFDLFFVWLAFYYLRYLSICLIVEWRLLKAFSPTLNIHLLTQCAANGWTSQWKHANGFRNRQVHYQRRGIESNYSTPARRAQVKRARLTYPAAVNWLIIILKASSCDSYRQAQALQLVTYFEFKKGGSILPCKIKISLISIPWAWLIMVVL